jgi:hypothetical protein
MGEPFLELRKHPSKLDLPVLRTVTRHGGLSDRMLDDSTFRYYFQRTVLTAGYYGELTIHAFRRAVANAVDSKTPSPSLFGCFYTAVTLMQAIKQGFESCKVSRHSQFPILISGSRDPLPFLFV